MIKNFDFVGFFKKAIIISAALILAGVIIACIFGIDFDITFVGGSRFTYSYTGELAPADVEAAIADELELDADVTLSAGLSDDSKKVILAFDDDIVSASKPELISKALESETESDGSSEESAGVETPETEEDDSMIEIKNAITAVLNKKFADNKIALSESNTVNPTLAGSFLVKALVAVALAAVFVIVYIGIRFRKIGGVSAAVSALVALIHDCIIAVLVCVAFGLEIDANVFAVVLTLFGYSLNATIVIFDRVRENEIVMHKATVRERVNASINQTLLRSVITSLTTFLAIVAIIVVAEINGVTALRSFTIPMAAGVVSGCFSSVCISGPLWVLWMEKRSAKKTA